MNCSAWERFHVAGAGAREHAEREGRKFGPRAWWLRGPEKIWLFMEARAIAVEGHAPALPVVCGYGHAPRSGKGPRITVSVPAILLSIALVVAQDCGRLHIVPIDRVAGQ